MSARSPKRYSAFILLLAGLALPGPAAAGDILPIMAAYYDNLNKLNIKGGIMLLDAQDEGTPTCKHTPRCSDTFKYMDVELGMEGVKLTAGVGSEHFESIGRIGLSYARFRGQRLLGIEGNVWSMMLEFKLGLYRGLNGTPSRFMLGMGIGF